MISTRSGRPPRFLLFRSAQSWALKSESFVLNFLFGFLPMILIAVVAAVVGIGALGEVFDPSDAVHRLSRPARAGTVLARGRLGATGGPGSLCVATTEVHEKNGWRETARVTSGDGVVFVTDAGETLDVDWSDASWSPDPHLTEMSPAREPRWANQLPRGGRHLEACLRAAPLFVAGCQEGNRVVSCAAERLVLTPGDGTPQPRIDRRAASLAGSATSLGLGITVALAYVYWSFLRDRALTAALLLGASRPKTPRGALLLLALPVIAFGITLSLGALRLDPGGVDIERHGYALATLWATIAFGFAVLVRTERRAVVLAAAPVIDTPTMPIASARAGLVELAVQVDADAPVTVGPVTGAPHAFAAILVQEVGRSGKNYAVIRTFDHNPAPLVPVHDASGSGLLDLAEAGCDIRAVRTTVYRDHRAWVAHGALLGSAAAATEAAVLEERFLDPGESIYVLGKVTHVEADAAASAGYREARARPRIAPMLVYAGSERSLLARLALERRYLTVAEIAGVVVAVATAGVALYLAVL